jgi:catechol 2,3-dioxygenase-like lactoylglutathione lyase family enzyme
MSDEALLRWPTWIGVVVDDLEGQRRFWGRLLGVPEDHSGPGFVDFELGERRSFELIKRSDTPEYDGLRFQVGFEVDDIAAANQELVRLGAIPIGGIVEDDAGAPWAYFRDPEGNVFEIKQRPDTTSAATSTAN